MKKRISLFFKQPDFEEMKQQFLTCFKHDLHFKSDTVSYSIQLSVSYFNFIFYRKLLVVGLFLIIGSHLVFSIIKDFYNEVFISTIISLIISAVLLVLYYITRKWLPIPSISDIRTLDKLCLQIEKLVEIHNISNFETISKIFNNPSDDENIVRRYYLERYIAMRKSNWDTVTKNNDSQGNALSRLILLRMSFSDKFTNEKLEEEDILLFSLFLDISAKNMQNHNIGYNLFNDMQDLEFSYSQIRDNKNTADLKRALTKVKVKLNNTLSIVESTLEKIGSAFTQ